MKLSLEGLSSELLSELLPMLEVVDGGRDADEAIECCTRSDRRSTMPAPAMTEAES